MHDVILESINNIAYLKIGFGSQSRFTDVTIRSPFKIFNYESEIFSEKSIISTWRIKINKVHKNDVKYRILIAESYYFEELEIIKSQILDISTVIETVGGNVKINNKEITKNLKYMLYSIDFDYKKEALEAIKLHFKSFNVLLVNKYLNKAHAELEIFDSNYKHNFILSDHVFFKLENESADVTVNSYEYFDEELEKNSNKNLHVNGNLLIAINNDSNLDLINHISLENYIHRVIFSELGTNMPLEFYKSMAVASRCMVFNRIGQAHLTDNYHFHATQDNLLFEANLYKSDVIDQAVEETKNEVMYFDQHICQAFFNITCGGQTENGNITLNLAKRLNYSAISDSKKNDLLDLQNEENLFKWINTSVDSYCNLHNLDDMPKQLKIGKRYFRWEEIISTQSLNKKILDLNYDDLGTLFDIVIHKRSQSGHIIEIELLGSHRNITINSNIAIRKLFGKKLLPSACFIIEREIDIEGFISSFKFKGAGYGHGVGLCKTGATIMANQGYTYKKILNHYYVNCDIKKVY